MKRRGRKARRPKAASPSAVADNSDAESDRSPSSNHAPHARSRRHPSRTPFKGESDSEFSDEDVGDRIDEYKNPREQDLKPQCPRHQDMIEEYETMRTLYSHFPDDRLQLLSHVMSIVALHLIIFPFVNCIWTYHMAKQDDLMNIVDFITYYPKESFKDHLFDFDWVTLPYFNADFFSFVLAVVAKDRLSKYWNRIVFDVLRVARGTVRRMTRRYRN